MTDQPYIPQSHFLQFLALLTSEDFPDEVMRVAYAHAVAEAEYVYKLRDPDWVSTTGMCNAAIRKVPEDFDVVLVDDGWLLRILSTTNPGKEKNKQIQIILENFKLQYLFPVFLSSAATSTEFDALFGDEIASALNAFPKIYLRDNIFINACQELTNETDDHFGQRNRWPSYLKRSDIFNFVNTLLDETKQLVMLFRPFDFRDTLSLREIEAKRAYKSPQSQCVSIDELSDALQTLLQKPRPFPVDADPRWKEYYRKKIFGYLPRVVMSCDLRRHFSLAPKMFLRPRKRRQFYEVRLDDEVALLGSVQMQPHESDPIPICTTSVKGQLEQIAELIANSIAEQELTAPYSIFFSDFDDTISRGSGDPVGCPYDKRIEGQKALDAHNIFRVLLTTRSRKIDEEGDIGQFTKPLEESGFHANAFVGLVLKKADAIDYIVRHAVRSLNKMREKKAEASGSSFWERAKVSDFSALLVDDQPHEIVPCEAYENIAAFQMKGCESVDEFCQLPFFSLLEEWLIERPKSKRVTPISDAEVVTTFVAEPFDSVRTQAVGVQVTRPGFWRASNKTLNPLAESFVPGQQIEGLKQGLNG
jgi:hypothetical protein